MDNSRPLRNRAWLDLTGYGELIMKLMAKPAVVLVRVKVFEAQPILGASWWEPHKKGSRNGCVTLCIELLAFLAFLWASACVQSGAEASRIDQIFRILHKALPSTWGSQACCTLGCLDLPRLSLGSVHVQGLRGKIGQAWVLVLNNSLAV